MLTFGVVLWLNLQVGGKLTRGASDLLFSGVCLAVMTDTIAPQVLSIKADKTSNVVTAGL